MTTSPFTPASFRFLKQLAANNTKEWFAAHKPEYESLVKAPCLALIEAMAAPLHKISPQMVANPKPVGGSLFRIHRDTRFSTDKSPYKIHAGMSFYHAATKSAARSEAGNANFGRLDAPVFYLHIQPGASFIGGGIWHPQPDSLKRIRAYLLNNPRSWQAATQSSAFKKNFALGGESLQRPPQGIAPDHPLVTDLKRKDFVASAPLSDAEVCDPAFAKLAARHFGTVAPLLDWLCGALDLDF